MSFQKVVLFCCLLMEINAHGDHGSIIANLNTYMDKVFTNLHDVIISSGLDPYQLSDQFFTVPYAGNLNLTKGWLQDLSTLSRNGDITITYIPSIEQIHLNVPIKFNDLMFNYDYQSRVVLVDIQGEVVGKVSNVKIDTRTALNMINHTASIEDFDITNTGEISLRFEGNDHTDWLINEITSTTEKILHPVILRVVQYVIRGGLQTTIDKINEKIKEMFDNDNIQ